MCTPARQVSRTVVCTHLALFPSYLCLPQNARTNIQNVENHFVETTRQENGCTLSAVELVNCAVSYHRNKKSHLIFFLFFHVSVLGLLVTLAATVIGLARVLIKIIDTRRMRVSQASFELKNKQKTSQQIVGLFESMIMQIISVKVDSMLLVLNTSKLSYLVNMTVAK